MYKEQLLSTDVKPNPQRAGEGSHSYSGFSQAVHQERTDVLELSSLPGAFQPLHRTSATTTPSMNHSTREVYSYQLDKSLLLRAGSFNSISLAEGASIDVHSSCFGNKNSSLTLKAMVLNSSIFSLPRQKPVPQGFLKFQLTGVKIIILPENNTLTFQRRFCSSATSRFLNPSGRVSLSPTPKLLHFHT